MKSFSVTASARLRPGRDRTFEVQPGYLTDLNLDNLRYDFDLAILARSPAASEASEAS